MPKTVALPMLMLHRESHSPGVLPTAQNPPPTHVLGEYFPCISQLPQWSAQRQSDATLCDNSGRRHTVADGPGRSDRASQALPRGIASEHTSEDIAIFFAVAGLRNLIIYQLNK